jgi:hypothetical protein
VVAVVLGSVLAGLGTGAAVAAFTARESNPQTLTAAPPPQPAVTLAAQSKSNDAGASGSQIQFGLRLVNRGTTAATLDTVTMRYWFTADGAENLTTACNYATYGCAKIRLAITELTAPREKADHYLQVSFNAATLAAGQSAALDQLAVRDLLGDQMQQSDDWSFANRTSFADNANVTVYVGGQLVWGTEPAAVPVTEDLEVEYETRAGSPVDDTMVPTIKINDIGNAEVDLRRVTVRYWFTKDTTTQALLGFCDSAIIGCSKISLTFVPVSPVRPKADTYIEVRFTGGVIPAEGTTGEIQLRVNKADHSDFDERNDYSWDNIHKFELNPRITAYIDGQLVWGTPP